MSNNHLIIGLGGTGGKIIRAFKKTIFQEFRSEKPQNVNIEYLYVDSSPEMMDLDDPSWKILGNSVQLRKHQQLLIRGGSDLSDTLDNIDRFPGIKSWIGSKEQWKDILNIKQGGEILGGQKRRLGRFLFACKIQDFNVQLQNLVRDLMLSGSRAVTFHICCGLAGGTGSGSLIDVISQIRSSFPESESYRITIYALLPDTNPKPNWDTGNYHANGYASLLELNSLSVGAWKPHDVSGIKDRLDLRDTFNQSYLFTNENDNGLFVDVDKDIPNIVADFLYQKLIAIDESGLDILRRLEDFENLNIAPECAHGTTKAERSKRFLAFGIKRLAVPEEEIHEYMTLNFSLQTALQIQFNNWSDSRGFVDEARNQSVAEIVSDEEVKARWLITDEHICLSLGILQDEIRNKKWKPIKNDWKAVIPKFSDDVRQLNSKTWLDKIALLCEKRFMQDYRGQGVRKFYEIKTSEYKAHIKEIRKQVESDLFSEWENGIKSLFEIGSIIDNLLEDLEKRLNNCEDCGLKAKENADAAGKKIEANSKEWAKIGPLSDLFGKRDNLLDAQATCLEDYYIHQTYFEAWKFAKGLLKELISEFRSFKNELDKCQNLVNEAVKNFVRGIDERCADKGASDLRRSLVNFYNPQAVREFTKYMIKDRAIQLNQANEVRKALIKQLGEAPDFTAFNARITKQRFIDTLESNCEKKAIEAHNNIIATQKDMNSQLGVSIIEKLFKEYGNDEQGLRKYMHDIVSRAGNYLIFNAQEVNKRGPGISDSPMKISQFTVILPKASEHSDFSDKVKEAIRGSRSDHIEVMESDAKKNEVSFISITTLFPLRFIKQVALLKSRYEQRLRCTDTERAKLELHCEGNGSEHPKLYVASLEEVTKEGLPLVLIAKAIGAIQLIKSETTGKIELTFISKDQDGFDYPIKLGGALIDSAEKIDSGNIDIIRSSVQKILAKDYIHIEKQEELKNLIRNDVESVKNFCKGDYDDPVYMRFLEAGKNAMKMIGK